MRRNTRISFAIVLLMISLPGVVAASNGSVRRLEFRQEVVNLEDFRGRLTQERPPVLGAASVPWAKPLYGGILRQLSGDPSTSSEHSVPFAVEMQNGIAVRAACDLNLNGDLTDDPILPLAGYPGEPRSRSFLAHLRWTATGNGGGMPIDRLVRVVVEGVDSTGAVVAYRTQYVYGMLSDVDLDGHRCKALLFDGNHDGLYTADGLDGVFFDLDQDRHFTINPMAADFAPFGIPISVQGRGYVLEPGDPAGSQVELQSVGAMPESTDPAAGELVQDFQYKDTDGRSVSLSNFRGRPVLIYFWSSWCSSCRGHASEVRALYDRFHGSGLEILSVSYDTDREAMNRFRAEHGYTWPVSFCGGMPSRDTLGRLFREDGSGVFYLIGGDGRLVARMFMPEEVEAQLRHDPKSGPQAANFEITPLETSTKR